MVCWCVNGLVVRCDGVRAVLVCGHVQVRVASACPRRKVGDRHGHRAEVCYAPCVQLCCDADWLRVRRAVLRIGSVCDYTEVGEISV